MEYTVEESTEAVRRIGSTRQKLRAAFVTPEKMKQPERYRPQVTPARRRVKALEIAGGLIAERLRTEVRT